MQESRVRRKAKRFFLQLVKSRVQTAPPMDPKTKCKKLNRRIQVRDEQVSYQSSNCRRARSILAKISTMSDLNRPAKVGEMQAEVSSSSGTEKPFTSLSYLECTPPTWLDAGKYLLET
jgi:hypothetical protein